ncbi:hypothetical protein X975_19317, partial [Stegodyphus mimosarum]
MFFFFRYRVAITRFEIIKFLNQKFVKVLQNMKSAKNKFQIKSCRCPYSVEICVIQTFMALGSVILSQRDKHTYLYADSSLFNFLKYVRF